MAQSCVTLLAKGWAITCTMRLVLGHMQGSESYLISRMAC